MAKKPSFNFTENWFLERGYTKNPDGSWQSPKFQNPLKRNDEPVYAALSADILNIYSPKGEKLVIKQKVNDSKSFEVNPVTEWFIPYQVPSKKNGRQNFIGDNGQQTSLPSKRHREYVRLTKMYYETFGIEFRRSVQQLGLAYPLYVEFTFVRSNRHKFDYCNACQSVEDLMKDEYKKKLLVKKGWIPDDSCEYLLPSFKPYEYDKNNPGVRIKLLLK